MLLHITLIALALYASFLLGATWASRHTPTPQPRRPIQWSNN